MLNKALTALLLALGAANSPHYPTAELVWYGEAGCALPAGSSTSSTTLLSSFCQYAAPPAGYYSVNCLDAEGGFLSFGCNSDCSACDAVSPFSSGDCVASPKAPGSASFRALCAPPTNPVLHVGRCQLIFFADATCLRGEAPLFHSKCR